MPVVTVAARRASRGRSPFRVPAAPRSRPQDPGLEPATSLRAIAFDLHEAQSNPFSAAPEYFLGNDYY